MKTALKTALLCLILELAGCAGVARQPASVVDETAIQEFMQTLAQKSSLGSEKEVEQAIDQLLQENPTKLSNARSIRSLSDLEALEREDPSQISAALKGLEELPSFYEKLAVDSDTVQAARRAALKNLEFAKSVRTEGVANLQKGSETGSVNPLLTSSNAELRLVADHVRGPRFATSPYARIESLSYDDVAYVVEKLQGSNLGGTYEARESAEAVSTLSELFKRGKIQKMSDSETLKLLNLIRFPASKRDLLEILQKTYPDNAYYQELLYTGYLARTTVADKISLQPGTLVEIDLYGRRGTLQVHRELIEAGERSESEWWLSLKKQSQGGSTNYKGTNPYANIERLSFDDIYYVVSEIHCDWSDFRLNAERGGLAVTTFTELRRLGKLGALTPSQVQEILDRIFDPFAKKDMKAILTNPE